MCTVLYMQPQSLPFAARSMYDVMLLQTKEFGSADNSDLYADEKAAQEAARRAAVPGLVNPNEVKDEQVMDD